jgi:hypothetical protein
VWDFHWIKSFTVKYCVRLPLNTKRYRQVRCQTFTEYKALPSSTVWDFHWIQSVTVKYCVRLSLNTKRYRQVLCETFTEYKALPSSTVWDFHWVQSVTVKYCVRLSLNTKRYPQVLCETFTEHKATASEGTERKMTRASFLNTAGRRECNGPTWWWQDEAYMKEWYWDWGYVAWPELLMLTMLQFLDGHPIYHVLSLRSKSAD